MPQEIVQIIRSFYENFTCRVRNDGNLNFAVKTGVRQGCVMSFLLFNNAINWIMKRTTAEGPMGICWTLTSKLEDLDFADDLALLSHTYEHMQEKITHLNENAQQIGPKISRKKSEVMVLKTNERRRIKIEEDELPYMEEFTYLGSTVRNDGGAGKDIRIRIAKVRKNAFNMLNNIWKSQQYSLKTKVRIYNSCVISTLLYGAECWRMTETDLRKLSTFHTKKTQKNEKSFLAAENIK